MPLTAGLDALAGLAQVVDVGQQLEGVSSGGRWNQSCDF